MKIIFFGDQHNKLKYQNQLIENLEDYIKYDIWLEFLYPEDIDLLNKINIENEDQIYQKILNNLKNNNWSIEYNSNLIKLIKKIKKLKITIFPLEDNKYSLKNFLKIYGIFGFLFYLNDRVSDKEDGCNDRWVKKVKSNQDITKKNQLIFAGNLHKKPIEKLLNSK